MPSLTRPAQDVKVRNDENMPRKPRILNVSIEEKMDDCPDLSYLGEFSNTPGKNAIDRAYRTDDGQLIAPRHEYRYFNAAMSGDDTGNPDSPEQDRQRMESYGNEWWMIGIIAKAEVQLSDSSTIQTIRSSGLWGIESDSGDYIDEVKKEQLAELKDELKSIGCTSRQIEQAFKNVKGIN